MGPAKVTGGITPNYTASASRGYGRGDAGYFSAFLLKAAKAGTFIV
jgi:hypothetical protein